MMIKKENLNLILYTFLMGRAYRESCQRWDMVGARAGQINLELRFYRKTGLTKLLLYRKSKDVKGKILDITL